MGRALFMEIPRYWREQPTNTSFKGDFKTDKDSGRMIFKYPGGEVPFLDAYDFVARLVEKGFVDEQINEVVNLFIRTVAPKASVPVAKVLESVG